MIELFFDLLQLNQSPTWLSQSDFEIIKQLGINRSSGRITYLAKKKNTEQTVVIKEFQFFSKTWEGYSLIEKEIQTLSTIEHPNIPKYLGKYETENSSCLIQEYIEAPSLASYGKFPLEEIREIALSILDTIVYLQSLNPPIFHRDIKPSNILYDQQERRVYLIDFGAARNEIVMGESTRLEGTPGFSPPEQLQGKELNFSSDLYSLGITLICLLSGISSEEINQLINHQFDIDFSGVALDDISWQFKDWLKKMVNPDPAQRFSSAFEAKQSLDNIPSKKVTIISSKKLKQVPKQSRIKSIIILLISLFNLVLGCSFFSYYFSLIITPFVALWKSWASLFEGSIVTFDVSLQTVWKATEFLRFTPLYGDWLKDQLYLWLDVSFNLTSEPDILLQFPSQLWNFLNLLCGIDMVQGIVFSICLFCLVLSNALIFQLFGRYLR